jgi:hypothetical protein
MAPEPVAAAGLERRPAGRRVEPASRRRNLGSATRLTPASTLGAAEWSDEEWSA